MNARCTQRLTTISAADAQTIVNQQYAPGRIPSARWQRGDGLEAVRLAMQSDAAHVFIFHRSLDDVTVLVGWEVADVARPVQMRLFEKGQE